MRPGRDRSDVEYVWPSTLRLPEATRTIYLDLNHWIGLAQANTGHSKGLQHRPALEAARSARAEGAVFPISGAHYMEMAGIRDPRQRQDLADVIEELSGFAVLLGHAALMRLEVDALLTALVCPDPSPLPEVPLLGASIFHAFGRKGGLKIHDGNGDSTAQLRETWKGGPVAFDDFMATMNLEMERRMLAGPTDDDAKQLAGTTWDPTVARTGQAKRAAQEEELRQILDSDPKWRAGRLRDVVSARYLAIELMDYVEQGLRDRGQGADELFAGRAESRLFVDAMPSGDVHVSLVTEAHRNAETSWGPNDMFDVDAMAVGVAYCDIVVTEKHRAHALTVSGVAERLGTTVARSLAELVRIL
jgi:hypothetical protein